MSMNSESHMQNPFALTPQQAEELDAAHAESLRYNSDPLDEVVRELADEKFAGQAAIAKIVAEKVRDAGGRALVVGGFVRDLVLRRLGKGVVSKDIDLEIYHLQLDKLKELLQAMADSDEVRKLAGRERVHMDEVGESFGAIKMAGLDIVVTRRDARTAPGMGRKAAAEPDPTLTYRQAAFRRDLTLNALALDPLTGQILDAFGGMDDLEHGVMRHIYDQDPNRTQFTDDPLRVLRVMQFASRFGFSVAPETLELCRNIPLTYKKAKNDERPGAIAADRVGEEWQKMLLKSSRPSVGLEVARQSLILEKLHPELNRLVLETSAGQNPWSDTLRAVDRAAEYLGQHPATEFPKIEILLAAICHKLETENSKKGKESEIEGLLGKMRLPSDVVTNVNRLVAALPSIAAARLLDDAAEEAIRRLALELSRGFTGLTVKHAVLLDRSIGSETGVEVDLDRLVRLAQELHVSEGPPSPVVTGKDLMEMGMKQGKGMGQILAKVFDEQLKGSFDDGDHVPDRDRVLEFAKKLV